MFKKRANKKPFSLHGRSREKGLTLVELLVVMVIGAVVALSVVSMFINQTRAMALNEDLVDLEQNLRVAMDMLHRDVRMGGAHSAGSFMPFGIGPLDCDGNGIAGDCRSDGIAGGPHAVAVRSAEEPGLEVLSTSGVNTFVCSGGSLKVPPGTSNLPVSLAFTNPPDFTDFITENQYISTGVGCPGVTCPVTSANPFGKCDNITFPSGTIMNGALPANPVGGLFWGKMNYTVYSISKDYDCDGTDDGPAALRRINNYGGCGVVAFGVNDMEVTYILEDGAETFAVSDLDTLAEQALIRRVRLTINGETRNAHNLGASSGKRTRTMTTEVLVRNLTY